MPMTRTGHHTRTTSEDTITLVRRLACDYDDRSIAAILAKQGRRTSTGLGWTQTRVKALRVSRGIPAHQPATVSKDVGASGEDVVVVSITAAEKMLGVSRVTLYRWLRDGFIIGQQLTPQAPWRIRIDQALRDRVRPEAPEGWLPLDQAAEGPRSGPADGCCTRSNAANSPPSTSTAAAAKAYVSRSNPTNLDYSTHPDERR